MPRHNRGNVLYDGCYAHVYSRALEKRHIFRDDNDFNNFKKLLFETQKKQEYRIFHYCLMHTHFHLIISPNKLEEFCLGIKEIKQKYAKWYQEKYDHKGPIWWGRFGSQLIENEKYLYACGLYVEMNPVKAGMVTSPEHWNYSSSKHYFLEQKDQLISNYDSPSYETGIDLTEGLNVGMGAYIGSPAFIVNETKGIK